MYVLYETASGYALFQRLVADEVALQDMEGAEFTRFGAQVKLVSFAPFQSAQDALDNINCVSEGLSFISLN